KVAPVAAECGAYLGCGTVLVVGQTLDHERHTIRAIGLVHNVRVLDGLAGKASPALNRTIDVVARYRVLLCFVYGIGECGVARQVGPADSRSDFNALDVFCESLRTTRIENCLLMLRGCPFGV